MRNPFKRKKSTNLPFPTPTTIVHSMSPELKRAVETAKKNAASKTK